MRNRLVLTAVLATPVACFAQSETATLSGRVTDVSGTPIPSAQVVVSNSDTNVEYRTATNRAGLYVVPNIPPGRYRVAAGTVGFASTVKTDLQLHVQEELSENFALTIGSTAQSVTLQALGHMLETSNADVGVTMTQSQIADLPLSDSDPFILARLVPGAVFTGNPQFTRPFDNSDVGAIRVNGAEGTNQFSLNGMPDVAHQIGFPENVIAYIPPEDSVEEFKMTTSAYSAGIGHTAAATVNVSTKSGTNGLHGTLYEYFRNEKLSANDFFSNNNGNPRPITRYNHFGGTLGGPVVVPGLYHGRDKTFFFFADDNLLDKFPNPGRDQTVPTEAERGGDFSRLCILGFDARGTCKDRALDSNGKPTSTVIHQIYNPFTAKVTSGTHVTRQPFKNNIIPQSLLSPIAGAYLKYYPLPSLPGERDGTQNFFSSNPREDTFHSYLWKLDQVIGSRHKLSATYYQNWRRELSGNFAGVVNGIKPSGTNLYYINHGTSLQDAVVFSPTLILDLRGGFTRFEDRRDPVNLGFDASSLRWSSAVTGLFTGIRYLPEFSISGYTPLGRSPANQDDVSNVIFTEPTATKVMGNHILTFGYDYRNIREYSSTPGDSSGEYSFGTDFAQRTDESSGEQGMGLVDFLLGLPTGGHIDRNDSSANQRNFHAGFIQDDWKVGARLTLNLGVRYEYEGAPTERFNRNIRGFDIADPNPINLAAQAAFFKAFPRGNIALRANACGTGVVCPFAISLPNFQVLGGYRFPGPSNRSFYNVPLWNFQPRLGIAYQVLGNTVVRGGAAVYGVPFSGNNNNNGSPGFNQTGFSQTTDLDATNNNGVSFLSTLASPFPLGVASPSGPSFGLETGMGQNVTITPFDPSVEPKIGKSLHWSFDIQQELPKAWILDLGYVGNHSYNLARSTNYLNAIPPQYLSTSAIRDGAMKAINSELTARVSNPFAGLGPGGLTNGGFINGLPSTTTIPISQLLRPFPEFNTISSALYNGTSTYNAGWIRVEHRFDHGLGVYATYSWSKLLERLQSLNDFQTSPEHYVSSNDIPQRVTGTLIAEVPVGRGRRWGSALPGWLAGMVGGWQGGAIFQAQTGEPQSFGDVFYRGDPTLLRERFNASNIAHGGGIARNGKPIPGRVFDVTGFYPSGIFNPSEPSINLVNHVRTFPRVLPNFRSAGQNNWDLNAIKKFQVTETVTWEVRGDFLNAFNHPWFGALNGDALNPRRAAFGQITSQHNLPREVQLALRILF